MAKLIELPNGLLDGQDLFDFAEIDELRGKQQNYLADKNLVIGNIGHVPKILADMILSLQTKEGMRWKGDIHEAVEKLSAGDLQTILIKIREHTYGPRFYHSAKCPHCEHEMKNLRLDLDALEVDKYSIEARIEPKIVTLPKSEQEVELKPLYLRDFFNIIKFSQNNSDKLITSMLTVTIKRIGDNDRITPEVIDDIPVSDLQFLQEELEKMELEGSIDTKIEMTCSSCRKDYDTELNVFDPDFFSPTKGSTTSTT